MACHTLNMIDSYGDGWNGDTWHWVDASGGDTTGTLSSGSSGTAQLCFTGSSCYTLYVDDSGSYSSDSSWTVTDPAGSTVASGSADNTQHQICPPGSPSPGNSPTPAPTVPNPTPAPTVPRTCYTLNMADSYGDGWQGQTWSWVDSSGTGPSGTLSGGYTGTAQLCFPAATDCMRFSVRSVCSHWREVHFTWRGGTSR